MFCGTTLYVQEKWIGQKSKFRVDHQQLPLRECLFNMTYDMIGERGRVRGKKADDNQSHVFIVEVVRVSWLNLEPKP